MPFVSVCSTVYFLQMLEKEMSVQENEQKPSGLNATLNVNVVLLALVCVLGTVSYMNHYQQEPTCKCDSKAISQMQSDIANLQSRLNGLRNLGTPIGSPIGKSVGSPAP